ncbi:MAG TPA: hypothetical protein DEQ09_01770 [Bacteroidales bacterium]|nr:hypothetical protein [Bacteroidales bacterium]
MKRAYIATATISLLIIYSVSAQTEINTEDPFVLKNDHVQFIFEPEHMGLLSMTDLSTMTEHINPVDGKHLLWEIAFAKGKQLYTITNNYKPCSYASLENLADGSVRVKMEWNRLRWWNENDAVSVTVIVELPENSGIANWRIFVENNSDYWGLWSVLFPIINGFPEAGRYDIARPSFARGGQLIKNCDQKQSGRYPGSVWPMQFGSFSNGSNSVYLGTWDSGARAKEFVVEPIQDLNSQRYPIMFDGRRHRKFDPEPGERIYIIHYPDDMGVQGSDYPDYYPVAFGVYQGDWSDAARIYRPWALKQKWTGKGSLSERTDVPESILNLGLWIRDDWIWNDVDGTPEEMNKPLVDAARKLDVPIGLQWYRWHVPEFDNLYPHYLPAKNGFKERVADLKAHDIIVMPYINGSSVDMNISDFEKYEPHAVKDEAGGLRLHYYSNNSGRLLSMCGNQVFWQDEVESLVDDIKREYGVTGIYVDQVSGLFHELCFDKSHLHPLGGGNYWANGNRDLLAKVKNVALKNGGNMVVTSEGATEVFFDKLDANLFWSQPSEREIPLMQMVYSGYTLFFGSTCDYTKSNNYFRYAQGQAFIDGRQNGWMDLGLFKPEYKQKVEFLKKCGKYRLASLDYLVYGQLLDIIKPDNQIASFSDEGFGWGMYEKQRKAEIPGAEARLWKSEEDKLAIFLVNYTNKPILFTCTVDPSKYGLPVIKRSVKKLGPGKNKYIQSFTGIFIETINLDPAGIKIVELSPEKQ